MANTVDDTELRRRSARLWQPLVCCALLATIVVSGIILDVLVHSRALGVWMDVQWARMNDTPVLYNRQYLDTEDRVILQDLPTLDSSQGGVYFFGSSNMKWAMRIPDLPVEEQRLVHDFGGAEGSPFFQRQFVEYLVEHEDLLQAGPEKTMIVYGATFLNAKPAVDGERMMFPNLWRRYGLYEYDLRTGVRPAPIWSLAKPYSLEKARCSSFVQGCMDRLGRSFVPKTLRRRNQSIDPVVQRKIYAARMGPDWEENMTAHFEELKSFADYVGQRNMKVAIVLLPLASWHKGLVYADRYRELLTRFCKDNDVPLVDMSNLLTDDGFSDHIHANDRGLDVLAPALMDMAYDHLRRIGALPAATGQSNGRVPYDEHRAADPRSDAVLEARMGN